MLIHKSLTALLSLALCVACAVAPASRAAAQTGPPPPVPAPVRKPTPMPYKAVPGPRPAEGWLRYEFGASPFASVNLPERHETEIEFLPMGANDPASAYIFKGESDDGLYMLQIVENLPIAAERMSAKYKEGFYDGMLGGLANGLRQEMEKNGVMFKLEAGKSKPSKVGALDAREQDVTFGPLKGRVRVVVSGSRAFLILLMETGETFSDFGLAFLDSLEVRAAR